MQADGIDRVNGVLDKGVKSNVMHYLPSVLSLGQPALNLGSQLVLSLMCAHRFYLPINYVIKRQTQASEGRVSP
jgi:hypothetical protein